MNAPQLLHRSSALCNSWASCLHPTSSRFDHITPLLRQLHWLRAPERIQFKLAVLVYKCLHGTAPSYLANELQCSVDLEARRRLRCTSSSSLTVRRTRLSTVGDRAFPVAAARTWNSLPQHVTSAPSMSVFRGRLKAFLFRRSFLSMTRYHNFCSACAVTVVIFGHLNRSFYFFTYCRGPLLPSKCQNKFNASCAS